MSSKVFTEISIKVAGVVNLVFTDYFFVIW